MAYAQALQFWAEKFRLPVHLDYCPLVMSIMELMHVVKEHVIFYKQDILQGLGRIAPEIVDQDPAVPQGHPIPNPLQLTLEALLKPGRLMAPLPHYLDLHLRRPHQSNLSPCLLQMMLGIPCLALQTLCWRETPQSFQMNPK